MNLAPMHRYDFQHGDDFEVKYLGPNDERGRVQKERFAVTGAGYKVYFEMMRLLPSADWQARNPRKWGFGDITDAITGRRVWNFREFVNSPLAKSLGVYGFKGDMTTVCGEDNRTYVACHDRSGTLQHRFLLANLLPQWKAVEHVVVPPLPTVVPVTRALAPPPAVIFVDVPVPEVVPAEGVPPVSAPQTSASEEGPREATAADVAKVVHRSSEMLYFVREVLGRMPRAPAHLRDL